jgi:ribosomal subunit interface protein
MNIQISSQNIELETKERSRIESKIKKLFRYFVSTDTSIESTVLVIKTTNHHNKGDIYKTEIKLHSSGKEHYSEATSTDPRKAFDTAFLSIEKEIKSVGGKKNTLFRKGAKKIKEILRYQK